MEPIGHAKTLKILFCVNIYIELDSFFLQTLPIANFLKNGLRFIDRSFSLPNGIVKAGNPTVRRPYPEEIPK